ncbi:MAG: hypothetical protein KBC43_06030 [Bacteroidales bacterium]|nr:hypothetical protein [Bacteroidales bacterium]
MKRLITLLSFMILAQIGFGQPLTGTKNIPGDYADLATAITDLNTQGVGAGGVTLNLVASNPQTAPAGGYVIGGTGSAVLTTSSSSNPVIIQGNSNTITASAALTAGALNDGIFKIIGADWITIQGFTMQENAANTTTAAATNNMTEWGVALLYVTTTDGAQNNTVSGCTIDLNRTYQNTFGIYSNSTHSATNITTSATATGTAGGNSGLVITGNTVTDVNNGIVVVGPTAAADHNEGLTIGGSSPNANNITNFGTTGTFSGYANVSGTVNGILVRNTRNFTVSYNTVTSSNGGTTAGTLNGIHIPAYSSAPTGTITNSITNNTISLKSGVAAGAINGINHPSGSASTASTMNITYNNFQDCGHTVTASGAIIFILSASTHLNLTISNNTFTNLSVNTTGSVTFISHSYTVSATGTQTISNNSIVTAFAKTGAGGTITLATSSSSSTSGATINHTDNNFSNITVTGATTIAGWISSDGGTANKNYTNNTFSNWTGGTSSITAMNINWGGGAGGNGNVISGNTISNLTGAGSITGISVGSSATTSTINSNIISSLSSTGASATISGIASATPTTNIFKNKIYDLSGNQTGTLVNGINVTAGTTLNISNNLIGDLRATAATGLNCINGINASASSTYNVYYNTIYLAATSSSATTFGNSCITWSSSVTSFNHRNNILVNLSTPAQEGANLAANGIAACLRRSGGTGGTVPANYATTSNNNDFWCNPTAGTNNHMSYVEGTSTITNPCNTVANLIAFMVNRDQASIGESPNFLSTTGSNSNFLHINTTTNTGIESGANNISSYADDYDGDIRQGNGGYSGTGSAPDIGADEFEGQPNYTCTTPVPGNTQATANPICYGQSITLSLENTMSGTGNTYQWQSSPDNVTYTNIDGATSPTYNATPTTSQYYQCNVTCQGNSTNVASTPLQITFQNDILTTTPGSRCGTGTVDLEATGTGGSTIRWYENQSGGAALGSGSPWTTPVISTTTSYYAAAEGSTTGSTALSPGATTSSTYSNPFYSLWSNIHTQHLILASELIAAGFGAGDFNSIALDVTNAGTLPMIDLSVKIAHTSATTLTAFLAPSFTTVYTNASYMPTTGLNVLAFSPVFTWDGASNVVVEFCHGNASSSSTMSRTVKADNTSYNSSIRVYIGAATGASTVCANTTTNLLTYTVKPQFTINGVLICSSPRESVTATVTPAPAFSVTSNHTICNNTVTSMSVTSNVSNYDSYIWSPVTNLFTDDQCITGYTGTSATTVYFKSSTGGTYSYDCNATNAAECAAVETCDITNLPETTMISASPAYICVSGTSTLTSVPASGYGSATFQWQDSPDNSTFSDISGANSISYTTPTITSTTYYKLLVKLGTNTCYESNVATVAVSNPQVTGTTPNSRCGIGTVSLEATATGGSLKWYAASTGGSPLGSGSPFVTPVINTTTTFYAGAEAYSPGTRAVGSGATTSATYSNPFYSANSNNHTQHLILAEELYNAGLSAGDLTSVALDVTSAGSLPMIDLSVKIAHTTASGLTAFLSPSFATVYTNASYLPTTGLNVLTFSAPFTWDGTSNIVLEFCHGNASSSSTMSRTVKADNTAYNSTIKAHVGAATAASTVCADVTTNLVTYTVRPQFTFGGQTVCSSARSSVLATVTPPPALTLTANQSICNNSVATIAVTSTIADYDSYIWSPQTNLFTDVDCQNAYSGGTANTVYFKSATGGTYTITCTATNSVSGCANIVSSDITNLPTTVTVTATPAKHCQSGSSILTAVPATGYGTATFQWQDSPDNGTFSDISGANAISYTTPTITSTMYYRMQVKIEESVCYTSVADTVLINDPEVTGTSPGSRCGIGTVELEAAASEGAILKWYAAETGGTALGTGSPFTTPEISTSTTFYVGAESLGSVNEIGGRTNVVSTSGFLTTNWGVVFSVNQALTLNSTTIYPAGTGTVTIALQNSSGTELAVTSAIPVTGSGYTTPVVVNLGFSVPTGSGYRLVLKAYTGITDLIRESTNSFPYPSPSGAISVTNGWNGSTSTSYYWFYSLNVSVGCASTRTSVLATVNTPPTLTVTPSFTACSGYSDTLMVTSVLSNYETYTWSPVTDLYSDGACLVPYVYGTNTDTVFVKPSVAGAIIYTCTGTETVNGCVTQSNTTVTANATPVAPTTTDYNMCLGGTIPSGEGLQSTSAGGSLLTGSQTIFFDVAAQPVETNSAPGNIVSSTTMAAIPSNATVTSIVLTYINIEALGSSWQSDVKLGLSGALVNAAASGTGSANSSGIFNFTRTASSGITATLAGGTINLLYWDDVSDNTGAEATFPTGTSVASLVINYSYPDPVSIQWYTTPTGGTAQGSGSPFNPVGIYPLNSNTPGTYTWYAEILNGTCASPRASCDLVIGAALSATASADPATPVCSGTEVTLTANPVGGGTPYTYEWKVGENVVKTIQSFDTTLSTTTVFDLKVTDNCANTATASVTVTVKPIPTAGASSNTPVCAGQTLNLTGTSDIGNIFSWTGPNGFASGSQNPSIPSVTTAASGTYYFTATKDGCTSSTASCSVVINPTPSPVTITPPSAQIQPGEVQQLVASGGSLTGVVILSENFNGTTNNWTTVNNSTGGTPADAAWTLRPDGYTYSTHGTFHSNDNSQFYQSNSDDQGSGSTTATILQSPAFSTSGFSAVSVNFYHFYRHYSSGGSTALVQASVDGTNWTTLQTYNSADVGGFSTFNSASVPLTGPFLGQAVVYIRFKYDVNWGYYWNIDNVLINGTGTATFSWSPQDGLYTDANATLPYTGQDLSTVYASPDETTNYAATATSTLGCSNSNNVTVTVTCQEVTSFPYNQGFESAWPPICWSDETVASYGWDPSTSGAAHSGTGWAFCNLENASLVTPELNLATNSRLVFWFMAEDGDNPQNLDVKVGSNMIYQVSNANNTSYEMVEVDLSTYTGQTIEISFVGGTGAGGTDKGICIDDVKIASYTNVWTGAASASWGDPANWDSGLVPGTNDRIVIPSNPVSSRFPVIGNGVSATCYNLVLQSGATIDVEDGGTLNVLHP